MTSPLSVRLGAQRPRVSSVPSFLTSAGAEAVEFAAHLGLFLDPWQAWVLDQSLGERPDGRWSAFEVGLLVPRQNGKGSILEARELAGLFLFGEKKITHSAHEAKTAKDHFERIEGLLRRAGYGDDKIVYRRSTTEVSILVKRTGCKMQFFTRTPDGGRGLGGDVVILDEAYALTRDQMAALMPTMSARSITGNPQMWYTSSAGFADSEVLAGVRKSGEAKRDGLAYFDWSAAPGSDIYDREAWAAANPGLGVRISEAFIESEIEPLGAENFGRERLGLWAEDSAKTVISDGMWSDVADAESRTAGPVVFAVDADFERSSASIAVAGLNGAGRTHVELVDQRPGVSWAADRLIELYEKHQPRAVLLDASGPAASLVPVLQAAHIEPELITAQHMTRACGGFYDAVRTRTLSHTGLERRLTLAVLAGTKKPSGNAWVWKQRGAAVAATLAHYGQAKLRKPNKSRVVVLGD